MAQRQDRKRDDISSNARWLARLADRLPAGRRYILCLVKPAEKGEVWQVEVAGVERNREVGMSWLRAHVGP